MPFSTMSQCLKITQKSLIFTSEASSVNFQKTFGYAFLPLINFFEFLQILGILRYKKNHKEFKRIFKGQKRITKGFQSNRVRFFLQIFKHIVQHTGAKIHILSKNSRIENHTFYRIHLSKISIFTKFTFLNSHFSQNSHF